MKLKAPVFPPPFYPAEIGGSFLRIPKISEDISRRGPWCSNLATQQSSTIHSVPVKCEASQTSDLHSLVKRQPFLAEQLRNGPQQDFDQLLDPFPYKKSLLVVILMMILGYFWFQKVEESKGCTDFSFPSQASAAQARLQGQVSASGSAAAAPARLVVSLGVPNGEYHWATMEK